MSAYTDDHLVEQPAIQLMQDELGWDFVKCWDEWISGVNDLGRDGKRTISFQSKSTGGCNALKNKVFLFKWKTSA